MAVFNTFRLSVSFVNPIECSWYATTATVFIVSSGSVALGWTAWLNGQLEPSARLRMNRLCYGPFFGKIGRCGACYGGCAARSTGHVDV